MKSPLDERHVRTDDFQTRVVGLEFAPEVWAVFAQLEQPRSANEIAPLAKLAPKVVQSALALLLKSALVRKQAMGWNEFATRPPTAAPAPAAPVVSTFTAAAPTADAPVVSLRIAATVPALPLVKLRLGGPAPADGKPAPVAPGWKLRPVLDAIAATVGGGVPGQLLVYKIFLQLPADLLKAAGLQSVNAVDDKTLITDPRLRDALVTAAKTHAKLDVSGLAVAA